MKNFVLKLGAIIGLCLVAPNSFAEETKATFTLTPESGIAPLTVILDASESSANGTIIDYAWSTSDGQKNIGRKASLTFEEPGTYTLVLTLTDDKENTATAEQTLTVNQPPTAAFSLNPESGKAPLTVTLNAAESTDADGTLTDYAWSSSDAQTTTGLESTLTFETPGIYHITLTVTDDAGQTAMAEKTLTVGPATSAAFTVYPESGDAPLTVTLDASEATGAITGYAWSSSEGQTSIGQNTHFTYYESGTYTISLTVTDDTGETATAEKTITIANQPPIAAFMITPCTDELPLIRLSADNLVELEGPIVEYNWSTTAGHQVSGREASLTFEQPGNYVITLTATNDKGEVQTFNETVAVCVSDLPTLPAGPPVAVIAAIPRNGPAPLTVMLDGSNSGGNVVDYQWRVKENGQTTFGHTSHLDFPEAGTYTVELIVSNSRGETDSIQQTVTVTAPLQKVPVADFRVSPNSGPVPLEITLDASASHDPDGEISEYSWLVSDGETELTASGETATLTLETEGSYTVNLTIRDNEGLETTTSDTVTVIEDIQTGEIAELAFVGLKDFYRVGERVEVDLRESLQVGSRFERVDIWVGVQIPRGDLLFKTDLAIKAFSSTPQAFRSDLETSEAIHRIFDFEVLSGMGGDYTLYALYVQTGSNPLTDAFSVRRSEMAIAKTHFANR
jgi:PKD repeat protein